MGSTGALLAIGLLIALLGGAMIGIIGIVSAASRHEDSNYSLDREAPNGACRGARRFTRVWVLGSAIKPAGYQPVPADHGNQRQEEARQ
jgi:hypothetical protein